MPDASQWTQVKRLQTNLNGKITETQKDRAIPSLGGYYAGISGIHSLPKNAVIPTKYIPVPPPDPCLGLTLITSGVFSGKYRDSIGIIYEDCLRVSILGFNGTPDSVISLTIPDSVTTIASGTFDGFINMTSLTLSNRLQSIGDSTFNNCQSLTSLKIPNSVTSIGNSAFAGCNSLQSVIIGNGVISIGSLAFISDNIAPLLTSITLGNKVETIGNNAFQNASPALIVFPDSVKTIGQYAFIGNQNSSWAIRFGTGSQLTSQGLGNPSFTPTTTPATINICNPPGTWNNSTAFGDLTYITITNNCP